MSDRPVLKLDWCSHAAARYAVEQWHYSHSLPTPPLVKIGCWESGQFRGCVVFSRGANNNLCRRYRLAITEICELTRVALTTHHTPVSRIVRIAVRLLSASNSGLRLLVSYADPNHGHHGGIYQALGWIYDGQTGSDFAAIDRHGRRWHSRQVSPSGVSRQYGQYRHVPKQSDCRLIPLLGKYRYLYALDVAMRTQIAPLALPYPKRATSIRADASAVQAEEGGASPTVALIGEQSHRLAEYHARGGQADGA
jgi:hypothetical protein